MIDLPQIFKSKDLNIDIGVRCTLQCHDCARTKIMKKGGKVPGQDITLEQFDKITNFFVGNEIHFCGWWSDPIFNPDFIAMLEMCESKGVIPVIHTAASHKPERWYIEAFSKSPNAIWRFGIDGLPRNSHRYRVNQDGEKLFKIMLLGKSMGINVEWQYIVFPYNEKSIDKAKRIAAKQKIPIIFIETERNQEMQRILYTKKVFKGAKRR